MRRQQQIQLQPQITQNTQMEPLGDLRVLRDLYNEGIDLPFVDTLLLLRPTQSAILFLQQLGRGLRLHTGKAADVRSLDEPAFDHYLLQLWPSAPAADRVLGSLAELSEALLALA